jgi:hypothetical protein
MMHLLRKIQPNRSGQMPKIILTNIPAEDALPG